MLQKFRGLTGFLLFILFSIAFSGNAFAVEGTNLTIGEKVSGEITDTGNHKTYTLHLNEPGLLSIDFASYIDYRVNLQLKDDQGNQIFSKGIYYGTATNPKKWSTSEYLEAGTYYVHVNQDSNDTGKYELEVHFSATNNNEIEPNNGTVQAPLIKPNQLVTGLISWNDHQDTFKISLQEPGLLDLQVASYIDYRVNVQLEDDQGKQIFSKGIYYGTATNPKKWNTSEYLEAGTYYVHVNQDSNDTGKYDLEFNFSATENNEIEPNNGTVDAQVIGLNEKVTGLISWNDGWDTFKISLSNPTEVILNINSYIDYRVAVQLEDSQGKQIFSKGIYNGTATNPKSYTKSIDLKAGTYYVHVKQDSNDTGKYELSILNQMNFKDVYPGTSYYNAVARLTSNGTIHGFGDNTFRPDQPLTRLDAILLMQRALDLDIPSNYNDIAGKFSDVGKNHRRAKEVAAVYKADIFLGYSNKMGLSDQLTREQMASVLVRAFKLQGDSEINHLDQVSDAFKISASHRNDVETLYDLGITSGKGNGAYAPKDTITRGEFAIFLDRIMN